MAKKEQVDKDFQDLFLGSKLGPKVLGKMLTEVSFLNIPETEDKQIAQNFMKKILALCGIGLGMTGEQYVRALAGKKLEADKETEDDD